MAAAVDTLARFARSTPAPLLNLVGVSPLRGAVVGTIFRQMPRRLKPSAKAPDFVARWDVTGAGEGVETWYVVVEGGRCRTTRRHDGANPRTTFTVSASDLVRLASGAANPMALFQEGRIGISGDLFFAAQMQSMFRIPA